MLNKEQVISAIRTNVPKFLLEQPIWIAYYFKQKPDGTYTKPPVKGYSVKEEDPGKTFEEVIKDGYPGIKITKQHPIIAFDIDDKLAKLGKRKFSFDNISPEFIQFLKEKKSYVELSPSGCGLRVLFQLDKSDLNGLPGRAMLNKYCLGGELFLSSGFVTITGKKLYGNKVSKISKDELTTWIKIEEKTKEPAITELINPISLPSIKQVIQALNTCRLDQGAAARRAYKTITGQEYNHYDYWFRILASVHHFSTLYRKDYETIISHILEWCKTDPIAYKDEEDVLTHWESLRQNSDAKQITYHTLFKFARLMAFEWPNEKLTSKGSPTGKPLPNDIANFEYLMQYYSIEVYQEVYTNNYYVKSDPNTLKKYFTTERTHIFFGKVGPLSPDDIIHCIWRLAQDNHYDNVTFSTIAPLVKNYLAIHAKELSILESWLQTPYEMLPEELKEPGTDPAYSTLDYILSCIKFGEFQNKKLIKAYFNAFFSGIVMPVYNKKWVWPDHNFMLILTGPENCRKTSFFSSLMPKQLREHLITHSIETLSSAKSLRDFMIQLTSSALLVVDEFEIFYSPQNSSLFKSLVTCSGVDYVPIYEKTVRKVKRIAALAGTTNKRRLPLDPENSRRVALVDVKYIDTDKLEKVNWHAFYSRYVEEGKKAIAKKKYPWKLSQQIINLQYQENERYRAKNDLETVLREIYDFSVPFPGLHKITSVQTSPWAKKLKDIRYDIMQAYPNLRFKASALANTLELVCGMWSKTLYRAGELPSCKGTYESGVIKQRHWTLYLLPPKKTDFEPETFDKSEEFSEEFSEENEDTFEEI